jgi:Abortive infection C-terminus
MSDIRLNCSASAIIGSESAVHLVEQKERLESALMAEDVALTLDLSKAFLESIFKTILTDRLDEPDMNQNFHALYRNVRDEMPLNRNPKAQEILKNLTSSIIHNVCELRNNFGAASHGDDGYFDNPIEMPEAEMVAMAVDGVASFLYRKHRVGQDPELAARIHYDDYPEFNDWLDGQYDGYELHLSGTNEFIFTASKMIFMNDSGLYRDMLLQHQSTQLEDDEAENLEVQATV